MNLELRQKLIDEIGVVDDIVDHVNDGWFRTIDGVSYHFEVTDGNVAVYNRINARPCGGPILEADLKVSVVNVIDIEQKKLNKRLLNMVNADLVDRAKTLKMSDTFVMDGVPFHWIISNGKIVITDQHNHIEPVEVSISINVEEEK